MHVLAISVPLGRRLASSGVGSTTASTIRAAIMIWRSSRRTSGIHGMGASELSVPVSSIFAFFVCEVWIAKYNCEPHTQGDVQQYELPLPRRVPLRAQGLWHCDVMCSGVTTGVKTCSHASILYILALVAMAAHVCAH